MKEWTGREWNMLLLKAENRKEWRKLVVKSTVVPNSQPDYGIDEIRRLAFPAGHSRTCLGYLTAESCGRN